MGDKALRGNRLTAQGGGRIAGPARRAQEHGFYSPDMGMRGRFAIGGAAAKAAKRIKKKLIKPKGVFKPKGFKGSDEVRALLKGLRPKRRTFKTHGKDVPTMAAEGGRAGYVIGGAAIKGATKLYKKYKKKKVYPETEELVHQKGPYVGDVGSERTKKGGRGSKTSKEQAGLWTRKARKEFKKGGTDKNWIQKAVDPKHKGFCTPMTKKTCTPRRKALARTFKKMGRERKAKG